MYYIVASHGQYAKACVKSCEMIIGDCPQFIAVSFTQDMAPDTLTELYRQVLEEHDPAACLGLVVDLKGGTPYNALSDIRRQYPQLPIISGLCLPLLIALGTGSTVEEAVKDARMNIAVENHPAQKQSDDGREKGTAAQSVDKSDAPATDNGIINLRLDERLIHGQVATYWSRSLDADRIMVIGDAIVADPVRKDALIAAVPAGIRLSVLTAETAARRLNSGLYHGQRVFVLVDNPKTIRSLLDGGVHIEEVNIGNMGKRDGRTEIKKSVYCTDDEKDMILAFEEAGVPVYAQMVPGDEKKRFRDFL